MVTVLKTLDPEKKPIDVTKLSLDEMRQLIGQYVTQNKNGSQLWDILTALRGPDSPSERASMTSAESSAAYAGRRKRKRQTVEVIRGKALLGMVGGAARYRTDINYVELPPTSEWDHFDKHVDRAAKALGIEVKTIGEGKPELPKGAVLVKPVEEAKEPGFPIYSKPGPLSSYSQWYGVPSGFIGPISTSQLPEVFEETNKAIAASGKKLVLTSKGTIKVEKIEPTPENVVSVKIVGDDASPF